jgi:uncharacterized protein (DUF305 family)
MAVVSEPELSDSDDDLEPLVAGRVVDLGRAILATVALMFLTGAAVFSWQQWAAQPHPNATDIGFADDMRSHHLQGVAMALAYLEDGTDPTLRQMANEIVLVQAGEARVLSQFLQDWGSPDLDLDNAMAWMGETVPQDQQPGMATDEQLVELGEAEGLELDDLFTSLMIEHHRGGIHMAQDAARHAHEADVRDLAQAMVTTQESEVAEMNLQREHLGLDPV